MRILSGIQPTGRFHWGNYFGAIKQYVALQDNEQAFYFIADLHALTTIRDPKVLAGFTRDAALDLLALGLNPDQATLFRQSDVPEVTELMWLLMTVTQMSLLEKCHAYKDKMAKGLAADAGLFTYPVLMAADILLYDSDLVPVGADQVQHIEVTRDIAQRFNSTYGGEFLHLPEARVLDSTAKVPGDRRRENVQELRQHDRDFRVAQSAPQEDHVDQDRFHSGRSAEEPGRMFHLHALQALRRAGAAGGLGRALPRRRHGLRRSEAGAVRRRDGLFRRSPRPPRATRRRSAHRGGRAHRRRDESPPQRPGSPGPSPASLRVVGAAGFR